MQLGRQDQHAHALVGLGADDAVDLLLGGDVDAAGRDRRGAGRSGRHPSHRARMTFCWLPPDRLARVCSGSAGRTPSAVVAARARTRSRRRWMTVPRVKRSSTGSVTLARTVKSRWPPSTLRSSGTRASPAATASPGWRNGPRCRPTSRRPVARRRPNRPFEENRLALTLQPGQPAHLARIERSGRSRPRWCRRRRSRRRAAPAAPPAQLCRRPASGPGTGSRPRGPPSSARCRHGRRQPGRPHRSCARP